VNAIMITLPEREGIADASVRRLLEAGVETKVFTQPPSWPVGPESNQRNAIRALMESSGDVLFVEDDVSVKPERLQRALQAAKEITYFYVHDTLEMVGRYPEKEFSKKAKVMLGEGKKNKSVFLDFNRTVVPEYVWDVGGESLFGSQSVFIPEDRVKQVIDFSFNNLSFEPKFPPRKSVSFDVLLNRFRKSFGVPGLVYMPHPVQHLESRVGRSPRARHAYSISFGLRSDLEVLDASGHD